jgi:NAD(P)-dependent dehydrogenase (short-subunit alcohol dehydrogenase family)
MPVLTDKVAVITGGAGGIGIAVGERCVAEGAEVLLVDHDETALQAAAQAIDGESVSYCLSDVTQPIQVESYVQCALERYGGIDFFFNNAGIEGEVKPIPDYSIETFDRVIAVNLRGVWLGLKYVIPPMRARGGGSIVITSSIAGYKGTPGISAYTASKHAVVGLMRTAALECAEAGIRVNTVHPAPIETRMIRSLEEQFVPGDPERARAERMRRIPMKRYGKPEEVANLAVFLASDESKYCTGGVYSVDGGISAA